jgi:hypothetical protein
VYLLYPYELTQVWDFGYSMSASLSNTIKFPSILNTHILYNPIDIYCQVV